MSCVALFSLRRMPVANLSEECQLLSKNASCREELRRMPVAELAFF